MVARIDPAMQEQLLKLLLAITDGRGSEAAQITLQIGTPLEDLDEARYRREVADLVGSYQNVAGRADAGRPRRHRPRPAWRPRTASAAAPELTMLGRALLQLDEIARALDPTSTPTQIVRQHSDSIMRRHMLKKLSPANVFASALEMQDFVQQLPGRLNSVLDNLAANKLRAQGRRLRRDPPDGQPAEDRQPHRRSAWCWRR